MNTSCDFVETTLSASKKLFNGDVDAVVLSSQRVIPLFVKDVVTHTQTQQRLHLQLFEMSLNDILECAVVAPEDWELLFVVLFSLMHRRDGVTPLQTQANLEVSNISFRLATKLLSTFHARFASTIASFKGLLERFHVPETLLTIPPTDPELTDPLPDLAPFPEEEADEIGAIDVPPVESPEHVPHHLHAYTLNCIPRELASDLTEAEFLAIERDFRRLDVDGTGHLSVGEIFSRVARMGHRHITNTKVFKELDKDGSGQLTLDEVVSGFFPNVPHRFIERRVQGVVVADDPTAVVPPSPAEMVAQMTLSEWELHNLHCRQKDETVAFDSTTAFALLMWFAAADRSGNLHLTWKDVVAAGGRIGDWELSEELWGEKEELDFKAFCAALFPTASDEDIEAIGGAALRRREDDRRREKQAHADDHAAWLELKRQETNSQQTLRRVSSSPKASAPVVEGPKPLPQPHREYLNAVEAAVLELRKEFFESRLRKAVVHAERNRVVAQHARLCKLHEDYHSAMDRKNVPLLYSCAPKPIELDLYGFHVSAATFHMDEFLRDDCTRPAAVAVLACLDNSGVSPEFLTADRPGLHVYLPSRRTLTTSVFRDFTVCPPRPGAHRPWQGDQEIVLTTSIPHQSDVKFRLQLEGYNYGVNSPINTIVCGYAGKSFERLDNLEEYGWPEGWDSNTVSHLSKGIEGLTQFATAEGFVAFRLTAKSFSLVGFCVTAWLVVHNFGAGMPLSVKIEHPPPVNVDASWGEPVQ